MYLAAASGIDQIMNQSGSKWHLDRNLLIVNHVIEKDTRRNILQKKWMFFILNTLYIYIYIYSKKR